MKSDSHQATLTPAALEHMLTLQDTPHALSQHDDNQSLATGQIDFSHSVSGIAIHTCDLVEQSDAHSKAMLSPCLSINFLLAGSVCFNLGEQRYCIRSENKKAAYFINHIQQPEVFTRFLKRGNAVKKVNITIEQSFLIARCQNEHDKQAIAALFATPTQVVSLPCTSELQQRAQQLFELQQTKNMMNTLKSEEIALNIIFQCVEQLKQDQIDPIAPLVTQSNQIDINLSKAIEQLEPNLTLPQIAQSLGMSISSLQRQIKNQYGMTAIELLRQKRLAKAKYALLVKGATIGEVAYQCGYQHVANFVTAFKKQYHITPAKLRQKHFESKD